MVRRVTGEGEGLFSPFRAVHWHVVQRPLARDNRKVRALGQDALGNSCNAGITRDLV